MFLFFFCSHTFVFSYLSFQSPFLPIRSIFPSLFIFILSAFVFQSLPYFFTSLVFPFFIPFYCLLDSPLFLLSFIRLFTCISFFSVILSYLTSVYLSLLYSSVSTNISSSSNAFLSVHLSSFLFASTSERFLYSTASRRSLGPTQPLCNRYRGLFHRGKETTVLHVPCLRMRVLLSFPQVSSWRHV